MRFACQGRSSVRSRRETTAWSILAFGEINPANDAELITPDRRLTRLELLQVGEPASVRAGERLELVGARGGELVDGLHDLRETRFGV